ncbi:MAG: ABC transporter ATP-binding protein [Gammaproteobacteria bacterium]
MRTISADDQPILRLQNVGVSYQRRSGLFRRTPFWALRNVSFDLYRGESLGVIGGNGAGKSTLLKLIAGIIDPDSGHVQRADLRAAMLSLRIGFLPYLTGRENAILSGMLMGIRRREIERNMDEIIAFSGLKDFIDQHLNTYSAGMKARLGFAVAFLSDPDILLVDEALGVGDAQFRRKSGKLMREKIKSDKTVVIVSHSTAQLRALCDRIVWIDKGVTKLVGSVDEVLSQYGGDEPAGLRRPHGGNKARRSHLA